MCVVPGEIRRPRTPASCRQTSPITRTKRSGLRPAEPDTRGAAADRLIQTRNGNREAVANIITTFLGEGVDAPMGLFHGNDPLHSFTAVLGPVKLRLSLELNRAVPRRLGPRVLLEPHESECGPYSASSGTAVFRQHMTHRCQVALSADHRLSAFLDGD